MATGVVKWFDGRKGYGFIMGPGGQDVFVHYSALVCDGFKVLRQGQEVEYDMHSTSKGLQALAVRALKRRATTAASQV
ncbi:MAG: cold-shock protein [Phycisphaerae bacterium]|jgi:CspA family cold shock protein|nr:cold-shock protein [Phycisphaerae bacterium]